MLRARLRKPMYDLRGRKGQWACAGDLLDALAPNSTILEKVNLMR